MLSLLLGGAFGAAVAWAVWLLVRHRLPSSLDNVPGPKPKSWLVGSTNDMFGTRARSFHKSLWQEYGPVVKLRTFLGQPMLYVYDPKAMHSIIIKDQYTYEETSVFLNFNQMIFGPSLLSSLGDEHRRQRKMLNPVFNINHMRYMSDTFYDIAHKLRKAIHQQVMDGPREIDMLKWLTRTALELLCQGGLGHSCDTLQVDEPNKLAEDVKAMIPTLRPFFIIARFIPIEKIVNVGPTSIRRWIVEHLPSKRVKRSVEITDHLSGVAKDILARKKALLQGDAAFREKVDEGKDIMSVLLKANTQASAEDRMSDEEFLGHMTSLMFAAMDTTSSALSRILYTLAEHPEVQEKLRQEIKEAHTEDGNMEYDKLMTLPYLEAVCRETLRVHAPAVMMSRTTVQDVVMPLSNPIKGNDGKFMSEIPVPKGTIVTVGILASNCNEELWGPDAHEWNPERWLKPLPQSVTDAHIPGVYSNLMTFLGGGRACIGFKFSQMEMKIVLAVLLETFKFSLGSQKITWSFGGIQAPTVGDDNTRTLPMLVELVTPA